MEARKDIRTVLKHSDDIFNDILSPLIDRGAYPYVYFYRIIGCDHEETYLAEIVSLDQKLGSLGNYSLFDQRIPIASNPSSIEAARKLLSQVPLNDYSNGALLNVLETQGYFSFASDLQVNRKIKAAFGIMLNLYMTNERAVNLSIIMNFVMKVLLWLVDYGKQIGKKSSYNPKIIYWGSPKTHEVYFLILMSLIGCDVLVLNTSFNDEFNKVDKLNEFSCLIKKATERQISAFPTQESSKEAQQGKEEPRPPVKGPPKLEQTTERDLRTYQSLIVLNDPAIIVKLKKTETIFEDIFVPMTKRSGYVGGPLPILPTYFMRYIGAPSSPDDWEAEYYNSLYNLDNALKPSGSYLKFLEGIPAPSAVESGLIPQRIISYPYRDRFEIIEQLLQVNLLPQMHDQLLDNTVRKTFVDSVNLFAEKSSNSNPSIILNFAIKLVTWFNRYLPKLLARNSGNKISADGLDYEYNPKILFYGTIKPQEIYFLNAFHKMGCDVLFIHSDEQGDLPFGTFDNDKLITQLMKHEHNLPLIRFPVSERLIRKSTIAYNASKEIEEVIYNEEVGLFKPWQFETYSTQPLTLKTTYDELKILWREPAKLRPEFKVQNKKVYVPNVFAKINGVSEDLEAYWRDLKELSSAPNTWLIEDVPFTNIGYSKQELYRADYLMNEQGSFDELKVLKSKHYKFGYLKAPLQHFLITKINELLYSGMFLTNVDEKFKLKILMTILTLDDSLIKLIEVFDYPQEIPKIIVYDNAKETFSENDAMLLAYFNLIGLDVVIFTPTNYKTIEQHIKPSLFDVHQLPFVKYDLALAPLNSISGVSAHKPGLLSWLFNRH